LSSDDASPAINVTHLLDGQSGLATLSGGSAFTSAQCHSRVMAAEKTTTIKLFTQTIKNTLIFLSKYSSHDLRKLIQPKNLKPYNDWYDLFAKSTTDGLDTNDEKTYDVLNKFCARDCIWDGNHVHLGHWGEVILRDMADKIYRENFK